MLRVLPSVVRLEGVVSCGSYLGALMETRQPGESVSLLDSLFVEVKTEKYNGRLYSADLITS